MGRKRQKDAWSHTLLINRHYLSWKSDYKTKDFTFI